jgi:hypothetical protein
LLFSEFRPSSWPLRVACVFLYREDCGTMVTSAGWAALSISPHMLACFRRAPRLHLGTFPFLSRAIKPLFKAFLENS